MDASSGPSSASNEKSALAEVFKHWKVSCLQSTNNASITATTNVSSQPPTSDELRADAKAFFGYLVNNTKVDVDGKDQLVLQTKSSHEDALAKLVQELGPAFSSKVHQCRLRGLSIIAGALEGCGSGENSNISNPICTLLGNFFLVHCGPILSNDEVEGDDLEEQIRDAAISGMVALIALRGIGDAIIVDGNVAVDAIKLRLSFAQQSVQHRCALPDTEEDEVGTDIRVGLSALPRSKRSLCFQLLDGAVTGVSAITDQLRAHRISDFYEIQQDLVLFASFATNCIHGESDPRCLLQLMKLLHSMQLVFECWFQTSKDSASVFPTVDIFDAVAPYYPIQFQPPPNNIHGITREGLHSALLSVLCYVGMDAEAKKHNRHTMLNLSAGLFLEQLLPSGNRTEDDGVDDIEKLEALQCIDTLLFPHQSSDSEAGGAKSNCDQLSVDIVRDLSLALITAHNDSSRGATQYGVKGRNKKHLAETCRALISKIAFQLEFTSLSESTLWKVFVLDPLEKESAYLKSAASRARTHIAFSACIAASGGPRTLRCCLKATVVPLLEGVLTRPLNELTQDYENVTAAAFGLGALFSSSRLAMERATKEGIEFHPHPLAQYSAKSFDSLYRILDEGDTSRSFAAIGTNPIEESPEQVKLPLSVKVSAVRALESVLLVTPPDQLPLGDDHNKICHLINLLNKVTSTASPIDEDIEWKRACGRTLGSLMGHTLDYDPESDGVSINPSVLETEAIRNTMLQAVYPTILASATTRNEAESSRVDRSVLAWACSCGRTASKSIVGSLLKSLADALRREKVDKFSTISAATTLSYILSNGGDVAISAYHEISDPEASDEVIIQALSQTGKFVNQLASRASFENLKLPATQEEREAIAIASRFSYEVIQHLMPAYTKFVPNVKVEKLIKAVSDVLPPLSDKDSVRLSNLLPLLAASIQGSNVADPHSNFMDTSEHQIEDMLAALTKDLAVYALSLDNHSQARTAAASCLHAAILAIGSSHSCPVLEILKNTIAPSLQSSRERIINSKDLNSFTPVLDCLNLLSILGSAAAGRRGESLASSDLIALFLVELACERKAILPLQDKQVSVDFSQSPRTQTNKAIEIAASAGFGSMLSTESKQVTKQRLKHIALKFTRGTREVRRVVLDNSADSSSPIENFGQVAIACHIICNSNKFEKKMINELSPIALSGLSSWFFEYIEGSVGYSGTLKLVLASTLKLVCVAPSSISSRIGVVRGLLRAYAISDTSLDIGSKLLALQGLEALALMDGGTEVIAIKSAVLSVLGAAVNHPSSLLRQGAVDVRNAWYTLE